MAKKNKKLKRTPGLQRKRKKSPGSHGAFFLQNILQQASTLHQAGRFSEAEALYKKILLKDPRQPDALNYLGLLAHQTGKSEVAVKLIGKSIKYRPAYAEAYANLGMALKTLGRLDEAIAKFQQAITLKPELEILHYNLGVTLTNQGKLDEAIASFRQALSLKPDFVEAYVNLGAALKEQEKFDEAIASFRQALSLKPDFVEAHNNLGLTLNSQGRLDEAVASYRRALTLNPDYPEIYNNLGLTLKNMGKLDEAVASFRQALSLKPDFADAHSNLLMCSNYLPNQSIFSYLDDARNFGRKVANMARGRFTKWVCSTRPSRLRVGIVSGDFRNHSVGYFLENMLANIDPNQIDLIAYPTNYKEDELTARIRTCFIAWEPIFGMNNEAAARFIHNDGVHILIDLSGHTAYNRLPVFAWKPAPVQATWLGYSASTGLAEMDYLLADPYIVPPGEEAHFTEKIWHLPESYLCFSPPKVTMDVGPLPAIKEGRITFGSFNNLAKMNDSVVALWAKILHAVPGSRLFLKEKKFSGSNMCKTTCQRFASFGITPERIVLEGYILQREEHLAAYNRVDIALDPFPYNGTTTSVEGLWMGVPFITLQGDRFISRVGKSIANNIGITDWVASDHEDYVSKAVDHTADLEKLARLRAGLRQQVLASPLLDGPGFARNFESSMWGMWHRFLDEQ